MCIFILYKDGHSGRPQAQSSHCFAVDRTAYFVILLPGSRAFGPWSFQGGYGECRGELRGEIEIPPTPSCVLDSPICATKGLSGCPQAQWSHCFAAAHTACFAILLPGSRARSPSGSIGALLATARTACFAILLRLASSATGGASATEPWSFQGGYGECRGELSASSGRIKRSERINRNKRCKRQRSNAPIEVADR